MSTVARGSAAENFVIRHFEALGYIAGSRRHIPGPGDQSFIHELGLRKNGFAAVLLVETKKCKPEQIWSNFRREDREAMRKQRLPFGGERLLVNVAGSGKTMRIDKVYREGEWPTRR